MGERQPSGYWGTDRAAIATTATAELDGSPVTVRATGDCGAEPRAGTGDPAVLHRLGRRSLRPQPELSFRILSARPLLRGGRCGDRADCRAEADRSVGAPRLRSNASGRVRFTDLSIRGGRALERSSLRRKISPRPRRARSMSARVRRLPGEAPPLCPTARPVPRPRSPCVWRMSSAPRSREPQARSPSR